VQDPSLPLGALCRSAGKWRTRRAIARKRRNSKRRRKIRLCVARLDVRIANRRWDLSHKLSRFPVDPFTYIAIEDLNIKGLARGMLAKSVADAVWNQLVRHVRPVFFIALRLTSWNS
jgi:putative transposase